MVFDYYYYYYFSSLFCFLLFLVHWKLRWIKITIYFNDAIMLITLLFCHGFSSRRRPVAVRGGCSALWTPQQPGDTSRHWFGPGLWMNSDFVDHKKINFINKETLQCLTFVSAHSSAAVRQCLTNKYSTTFNWTTTNSRRHFIHTQMTPTWRVSVFFVVVIRGKNSLEGSWDDDESWLRPLQSTSCESVKATTRQREWALFIWI